ncbi:MAG TPA: hypothetical protein VHO70_17885, partial [Chitinispirillaceae bacterium]|nr:hypothetical protein [Chitinispirillaceae bacterium]
MQNAPSPAKSQMPLLSLVHISAAMAFVFLTPLPMRKVWRDAFLLSSECASKPLVTLSYMDYFFPENSP